MKRPRPPAVATHGARAVFARRRVLLACGAGVVAGLPGVTAAAPAGFGSEGPAVVRGRRLAFPRDHGAHLQARTEWWYVTGWLAADAAGPDQPTHGFQVTFFRSRTPQAQVVIASGPAAGAGPPATLGVTGGTGVTGVTGVSGASGRSGRGGVGPGAPGRFSAQHLLFAHAAITDLAAGRHHHAQRIARWNGDPRTGPDRAALADADLTLARWRLRREGPAEAGNAAVWSTRLQAEGFALQGTLSATQPLLLQGDAGFSRKGPEEAQASHYYSVPQLAARLTLELNGRRFDAQGRAWLDHEWSDDLMHPQAVGWDWIGINLFDGSALTAFRLRRADGQALWAGGSWRSGGMAEGSSASSAAIAGAAAGAAGTAVRSFDAAEVRFEPGRRWRSPSTNANYPVVWQVETPAGRHTVRALLDAQELDGRGGTGAVYWEGLAELLDGSGRRIGLGYLEMTGYAAPLKLGG